jgi:hypothetical protein
MCVFVNETLWLSGEGHGALSCTRAAYTSTEGRVGRCNQSAGDAAAPGLLPVSRTIQPVGLLGGEGIQSRMEGTRARTQKIWVGLSVVAFRLVHSR